MPATQSHHPLAVSLYTVGQIGYPVIDNIEAYLEALYDAGLNDTLAAGDPGEAVIRNLAEAYGMIAEIIFLQPELICLQENDAYEQALKALPLFVDYVIEMQLSLGDLHHLTEIVTSFFDGETDDEGPAHLGVLKPSIQSLTNLFNRDEYKSAIYSALAEHSYKDVDDLIGMAHWFYGEDEFELFFSCAQHYPLRALSNSYWLIDLNEEQCQRFITWARRFMLSERLDKALSRTQAYTEVEERILDRVIFHEESLLKNQHDRRDFSTWGMCSDNLLMTLHSAYLLDDLAVPLWPVGSKAVIIDLLAEVEPHWMSVRKKDGKTEYVKSQDWLRELLGRVT